MWSGVVAITCVILICLLAGCGMFKDRVKYSGNCGGEGDGSNLKWTLTSSGTLTISGRGKMTDGVLPWNTFYGELHDKVKSVVLNDGITYIGHNAFYSCGNITGEVIIPDTVKMIGSFAFYECRGIESVKLPSGLERIESNAFRGLKGWTGNINLPDTVTFIGDSAFENCENLAGELHFSDNLTIIERCAFINCKSLTGDLILPDSLETLGDYAFSQCENLNGRLKLPNNLKTIEYDTFEYTGLTGDLVIPDSVTVIKEKAFCGCKNLNGTLTIGNGVKEIYFYSFYNTNFENIDFGGSLEFIGNNAFACNSAFSGILDFPSSLKYIGNDAFNNCPNVREIKLPDGLEVIADKAFSGVTQAGNTITLPESVWYAGKNDAAFKDSCFTNIAYKGERESDKEYKVKYRGEFLPPEAVGLHNSNGMTTPTGMQGMTGMQGSGDMAFVWIPKGKNLIGCGEFADTWLDFEQDILHIYRTYRGKEIKLADIPVKYINANEQILQTEEPFEYKGYTFRNFQHVRMNFFAEICMAYATDANGNEQTLIFGDFTEYADGVWSAYQQNFQ